MRKYIIINITKENTKFIITYKKHHAKKHEKNEEIIIPNNKTLETQFTKSAYILENNHEILNINYRGEQTCVMLKNNQEQIIDLIIYKNTAEQYPLLKEIKTTINEIIHESN